MRQPSALGFLVRHPLAIGVDVQGRSRHAFGPVLSDEVEQLVRNVRAIRGVQGVVNQLDVHTHANGIPALQGAKPKPAGEPLDIMQRHWSPATRFLVGAAGLLLAYELNRHARLRPTSGEAQVAC
jgi:hypothetical protein